MAKNMQPIAKRCKKLGIEPSVMGYNKKTTNRNSNGNMRRKKSEYCLQLNEKQKVKFIYGIMEKQFRRYYDLAAKKEGKTGTVLLTTIERRLDNVVFRLGLASSRREARQMVNHAHFTVNGEKVNIPSYLTKVGDVIKVKEKSTNSPKFKEVKEMTITVPEWVSVDVEKLEGKVLSVPTREQIDTPVAEHLIVELYSK